MRTARTSSRAKRNAAVGLAVAGSTLLLMSVLSRPSPAYAADASVGLGTAAAYSVLGGVTVTNTGPTTTSRNLGVSPGDAVTGFPPGIVGGATHAGDAPAAQAQSDLVIAYDDAAGRAPTESVADDLVGRTLTAGVYNSTGPLALGGTLTLDGQGNPNSVFIFQIASTLITASASDVDIVNGAQACHVFWQVGSSATLGTNSDFVGTIMALTSISVTTGTDVIGRALARNGQVSLDDNTFTTPDCDTPPSSTTTEPTDTTSPTTPSTSTTETTDSSSPTATSVSPTTSTSTSRTTKPSSSTSSSPATTTSTSINSSPPTTTKTTGTKITTSATTTQSSSTTGESTTTEESTTSTEATVPVTSDTDSGGYGGSGPGPSGPEDLAYTGAGFAPGPLLGLSGLLLMLGGALIAVVHIRSRRSRRPE